MKRLQQLALLLASLTASTAFDVNFLDGAILQDVLESYTEHTASTCTGAAGSTTFTFDWPGTNAASEWDPPFVAFEEENFLAAMSHTDAGDKSWTIRLGQGGNMYSHYCPDMHGETMPPQAHTDAPWIDEVHQSVSVNGYLNFGEARCNGQNCPANFVHGAGTYQRDTPYTDVPFYSQSVAKHCAGDSCTFAAWGQQAHVATIFTSSVMTFNKYTNCGNGIIEHTEMVHNFAPENAVSPSLVDQTYFNLPWSGVRRSTLPFALEPNKDTGELSYDDPDTVDYCPLCPWGSDEEGGPQDMGGGRCARTDMRNLRGYTTFVEPGLFVNRETQDQQFLWCRKPGADCYANPSTCMARPTECYNADGTAKTGYTPIQLRVAAGNTPRCTNHIGIFEGYQTVKCRMRATGFGNCGTYLYAGTSSDTCAPWLQGGSMGIYRNDTGAGITIPYVRHWSWSASNELMYFSVYSQDATEAINLVNSVFSNTGSATPLSLFFETFPPGETFPGPSYNPGALNAVTFVYGDGNDYNIVPGNGRRRMGSSNRDFTVFTINWWQTGAKLTPGDTFSKRAFVFLSELSAAKTTAEALVPKVIPDKIADTRWNPRAVDIYKSGASFDAVAATSIQGTSTTCSSTTATLECSGFSTPKAGHVPFFYITCGASTYVGPDPYHFTPGNGDWFTFPGLSNDNSKKIRSYACAGQDLSVRPTWKLLGWFNASTCSSLGSGLSYDDNICVVLTPPTNSPGTAAPTSPPTGQPVTAAPTSPPTAPPSANPTPVPTGQPVTAAPTPPPTGQPVTAAPTSPPTANPTPVPTGQPVTAAPTPPPTGQPVTAAPTSPPTAAPTSPPTAPPSANPTPAPTGQPVTAAPTPPPTSQPVTAAPTSPPSANPTPVPTGQPVTAAPTSPPTAPPSANPTPAPTGQPVTAAPTPPPTGQPVTAAPTSPPTGEPSANPTPAPTNPVQTVIKYVCAKNAPMDSTICADGNEAGFDGECFNENINDGCGKGGKSCWWADCGPPEPTTPPPTSTPPEPTTPPPTSVSTPIPTTGGTCPVCSSTGEPCCFDCIESGKPQNRGCFDLGSGGSGKKNI